MSFAYWVLYIDVWVGVCMCSSERWFNRLITWFSHQIWNLVKHFPYERMECLTHFTATYRVVVSLFIIIWTVQCIQIDIHIRHKSYVSFTLNDGKWKERAKRTVDTAIHGSDTNVHRNQSITIDWLKFQVSHQVFRIT